MKSLSRLPASNHTKPPAPAITATVMSAMPVNAMVMTRSVNSCPPSSSFIARASDGMSTALSTPPAAST